MTTVHVFDPAMCCSTGVCGPSVDPQLARFSADLGWLASQGVAVERFNLAQQPGAFVADDTVKGVLESKGEAGLPLVKVNGEVKSSGDYPSREQLAAWAGVGTPAASLYTDAVAELVAIGAAIAANCEPCFKFHFDKARKLGVSREDMSRAVATAQMVKDAPAKAIQELAQRHLSRDASATDEPKAQSSGCCGPSSKSESSAKSGCC
jgi:AhpD family alkylhydroperoxidase